MYHVCDITIKQCDAGNIDSWSNYKWAAATFVSGKGECGAKNA